jgi:hypothetical protein
MEQAWRVCVFTCRVVPLAVRETGKRTETVTVSLRTETVFVSSFEPAYEHEYSMSTGSN